MQVTLELNNKKTMSILKELESLNLLRIIKKQSKTDNLADVLENSISSEQAALMNSELEQMRNEWDRVF